MLGGKTLWLYIRDGKRTYLPVNCDEKIHHEILRVCKQIHCEAKLLPMRLNVFTLLADMVSLGPRIELFTVAQQDAIATLSTFFPDLKDNAQVIAYLSYFRGLRQVDVAFTNADQTHHELAGLTAKLREVTEKPHLEVLFYYLNANSENLHQCGVSCDIHATSSKLTLPILFT
jgi:hypothetical protein